MSNKSNPLFPEAKVSLDGVTYWPDRHNFRHISAHQAVLADTLEMCGCGDFEATIALVLDASSLVLTKGDRPYLDALSELVLKESQAAADILLHWLYEAQLVDHGSCLSGAWIDTAGQIVLKTGVLPSQCEIPETLQGDIFGLLLACDRSTQSFRDAARAFIKRDIGRAARLIEGFLRARDILEPVEDQFSPAILTGRGLQIVGIAMFRSKISPDTDPRQSAPRYESNLKSAA